MRHPSLVALVLEVVRTRTNLKRESATERFQTIVAAQPLAAKRQRATNEQVDEFVKELAAGASELTVDQITMAPEDDDRLLLAHVTALRVQLGLKPNDVPDHPGPAVVVPTSPPAALTAWGALMDLSEFRRQGWTLVGGQLVHLLAWEHGEESPRVTTDADVVINVRAYPTALHDVTANLIEHGFMEDGVSPDGIGHRYRHEEATDATIDVLVPEGLSVERFKTVTGARTIAAAGSVQALERSIRRTVELDGRQGSVIRPDLHSAIVLKRPLTRTKLGPRSPVDISRTLRTSHHYSPVTTRCRTSGRG